MNLWRKWIGLLALVTITGWVGIVQAQEVVLSPAESATPDVGQSVALTLNVNNINNLFGWQISIVYDSKVLKFSKFTEGGFLKAAGASFAVPAKDAAFAGDPDGLDRAVTVGATLLGGSANGSGDLGELVFSVVAKSATSVKLSGAKFLDPSPAEISVTTKNAKLTAAVENKPPKAVAGANQTVNVGATVRLDASASTDEDGTVATYAWDFGDGAKAATAKADHIYAKAGTYTVTLTVTDDKGATATATLTVTVTGQAVIREHTAASPGLRLTATFPKADTHGHAYISIWKGEWKVEAGQWLEYQVFMASGNPAFRAAVDMAASDGTTLRDVTSGGNRAMDQNNLHAHPATDLAAFARDKWYHRQISLDGLAGKTVTDITLAVDSDAHRAGVFNAYFDNVQITNKEVLLQEVYIDGANVPLPTPAKVATEAGNGGIKDMMDASVTASVTSVAVNPRGKLSITWGALKRQ